MKKNINIISLALLICFAACTQVESDINYPTGEKVNITVVASQEGDVQTKTHIGEHYSTGGYSVLWDEQGESIAVIEKFTLSGNVGIQRVVSSDYALSEDAKRATFMGLSLDVNDSDGGNFDYVVVSPSSVLEEENEDHSVVRLNLPSVQRPKMDSYDPSASVLIGSSLGNSTQQEVLDMNLKHIMAYAKMTVRNVATDDKIEMVEFVTEKDVYGVVLKYNVEDGTLVVDGAQKSVKIDVSSISQEGDSFDVYFTALPTIFQSGDKFSVRVSTSDKSYTKEWTMTETKKFDLIEQSLLTFSVDMTDAEQGDPISLIPNNEIWYESNTDDILTIGETVQFGANIISHTYSNGKGVIKFDGDVSMIKSEGPMFDAIWGLKSIYLPQTITHFESNIMNLGISGTLCSVFWDSINLEAFYGKYSSKDHKCLIVGDKLVAFAPYGVEEYTIPEGVRVIGAAAFYHNTELKKIVVPEGVEYIEHEAFMSNSEFESMLEEVYLPSTLTDAEFYIFAYCDKIKKFEGGSPLISEDGYSLLIDNYNNLNVKALVSFASGSSLTSYSIPEGVQLIESYGFSNAKKLREITFPKSLTSLASSHAFYKCYNIENVYGENVMDDGISYVVDSTLIYLAPKNLKQYITPKGVKALSYGVLADKPELESVVFSDEVVAVGDAIACKPYAIPLGYILWNCPKLKAVTISANMRILGMDPFGANSNETPEDLQAVYLRAQVPPVIGHNFPENIPGMFDDMTIYVPQQSLPAYLSSNQWAPYKSYIKGYNYDDLPQEDRYFSLDYSKDGEVVTLQTATKGKGIDVVLMGDAYSDREIADGTYRSDMENLYNNLFTEEPYKTYKDYFNVYYVNIVSAVEGYDNGSTALGGYFGNGTQVGGDDPLVFNYALNVISEEKMNEALLIVAMNSDNYAGTCYMYYPESASGTYGSGPSISYFPKGGDVETFAQLLHHEACGHGFAKLADEYAYEDYGEVPGDYAAETIVHQDSWGWWKNVDFTDDPSEVRWNYFLSDERYANDGLGVFEGGLTYWTGVWRPTENSIMRYNTGGFNAPSREAIYYRIHKLAYGADWEYDYEDFVEYDSINRKSASEASVASTTQYVYKPKPQLHTPVVVKNSWRDAK